MSNIVDPDRLLKKPTDLDLHYLQKQGISGFSRTWIRGNGSTLGDGGGEEGGWRDLCQNCFVSLLERDLLL